MKRVLVVLPFYGGSLPIGRYAASALEEAGCLVRVFEAPEFYSAFTALKNLKVGLERQEFLENSFLQNISQAVLAQVEAFRPDLVLAMAQAPLSRQVLKRLRADGVATAMWFVEDHRLFTYWQAFAPYYDIFAVIQKEPFFQKLKDIGVNNALYLPPACLPSLHRPVSAGPAEKRRFGSDLSFLGAGYPNRRRLFTRLKDFDFKIWGTEWEDAPDLASLVQEGGRRISPEEAVLIYNSSSINLNLHSSVGPEEVGRGDFVNPRTFELAACKAFQLVDRRSLMPELFREGELATFETAGELLESVRYYLNKPEERAAIAQRGFARVLAEHTYAARMKTLLNFAAERLPGFNAARPGPQWSEGLSSAVREDLTLLVEELGLPPDCGFEDLVTGIRSKAGTLSGTESALLFLDEWKKQYQRKN